MLIDVDINEIEQAISTLNRLKEIAAKNEEKWQPKGGSYHVSCHDHVHSTNDISESATNFGSRFETREAAEKAAKAYRRYHRLYKLAEELNEGWEPDWDDSSQPKHRLVYDCKAKRYYIEICHARRQVCGVSFKSDEVAQQAIKILEQEE